MDAWLKEVLTTLAQSPVCDYNATGKGATEPSCLAALALVAHEQANAAIPVGEFLASYQQELGCLGIRAASPQPTWTTSLALLVWKVLDSQKYTPQIQKALQWALSVEGQRIPREKSMGHDSMLAAWPWVEGTHSWLEPSAFFTLALKAHKLQEHARTREAVTLLTDRLFRDGGCNYGNTVVLGQTLRPHVQPSGIVSMALAGEADAFGRIGKTIAYLEQACTEELTPHSLAWALLGLAAHGKQVPQAPALLEKAFENVKRRGASPYSYALLANAALGEKCLLISS
jgi:hypothetical protein